MIERKEYTELARWLGQIALQDESALDRLYDATVQSVYSLAVRIVRNPAIAEEVVGDVYFQIWNQAVQFDELRGNALAWIMVIARSRALDAVRKLSGCKERTDMEAELDEAVAVGGPWDLLVSVDSRTRIYEALETLHETQRQLVALAFFRGYSHQELSDFTGMPLGSVKSHLNRSLAKLSAYLKQPEIRVGDVL